MVGMAELSIIYLSLHCDQIHGKRQLKGGRVYFDLPFWEYSPSWKGRHAQALVSPPFRVQPLS